MTFEEALLKLPPADLERAQLHMGVYGQVILHVEHDGTVVLMAPGTQLPCKDEEE